MRRFAAAALEATRGPLPRVGRVFDTTPQGATLAFSRAAKRAGIVGLRLHDLRAERISTLLEAGWSLPEVMAVSGHRSMVVARYMRHNDPAELARKMG